MNDIKKCFLFILSTIGIIFDKYSLFFILVIVAIIFDVVTGIVKSIICKNPLNSKTAFNGFLRKTTELIAVGFGVYIDVGVVELLKQCNYTIPFKLPFCTIISCYIIINECISIIDNIININPKLIPNKIKQFFIGMSEK